MSEMVARTTSGMQVEQARILARIAHEGQLDKFGVDYYQHLERVANKTGIGGGYVGNTRAAVGWLHDIVEDTSVTLLELSRFFPASIVDAVDAISHRDNEPNLEYYKRIKSNNLAWHVKLSDLSDNLSPQRMSNLDPATQARLSDKYAI